MWSEPEDVDGYYYLHVNNTLIYKRAYPGVKDDLRESDLVKRIWPVVKSDRCYAWVMAVEAMALDVDREQLEGLIQKWGLTDDDAKEFAHRMGLCLFMDGHMWCATYEDFEDLAVSPAGFGPTCLEAMAALAKEVLKPRLLAVAGD